MANRRKHANSIPLASLTKSIVAAFFVAVAGLSYVYCKNQLHTTANQIKSLEGELKKIDTQREVVRRRITTLSSYRALQQWLNDGVISMVPISEGNIVRLKTGPAISTGDFQPVANRGQVK